jgi:hypothetical protein
MLEQFMQESGDCERYVTVHELRDRFQLTRYQCTTVSGFLRRLKYGPFGRCPYLVVRIEKPSTTADNRACRYLVARGKKTLRASGKTPARYVPLNHLRPGGFMR